MESGLANETDCINWNQYYTDCKAGDKNPFHGAISFDNIGLAWVAIFLVGATSRVVLHFSNIKQLKKLEETYCIAFFGQDRVGFTSRRP